MKTFTKSILCLIIAFFTIGCNQMEYRMPYKLDRDSQKVDNNTLVTLSVKGVSKLPTSRFFVLGEKDYSGHKFGALDWSNQEGRTIPMHIMAYGYNASKQNIILLDFMATGIIEKKNNIPALRTVESGVKIVRVRYISNGVVTSSEDNPSNINSSVLDNCSYWKVGCFTNDTMSSSFDDDTTFDSSIDVQSSNKVNKFVLSNAKGCTINTTFSEGTNGRKVAKNVISKGLSAYNRNQRHSNEMQTFYFPMVSFNYINANVRTIERGDNKKELLFSFNNLDLRPVDCLVEYRIINRTGKDIDLQSLELQTKNEGHPVYYTTSFLDYSKLYGDYTQCDFYNVVRGWLNVKPSYNNADKFRDVFLLENQSDKNEMYSDNPFYTFKTPRINNNSEASFYVRAVVNYDLAKGVLPYDAPLWIKNELAAGGTSAVVGESAIMGKAARVHVVYNDGSDIRQNCMLIKAEKDKTWFATSKTMRINIVLRRENPIYKEIINPLEYMAEYNVNKEGTGMTETNDVPYLSGYFTLQEAVSLYERDGYKLGCYHLPSFSEWKSIVPQNDKLVFFRPYSAIKESIEEDIKVGNDIITSTRCIYNGVPDGTNYGTVYAIRLIGTKYQSLFKYKYSTYTYNGELVAKVTISCVPYSGSVDKSVLALNNINNIEALFNGADVVSRTLPADSWLKTEGILPTDGYIRQGLYWSSTENGGKYWRLFFSYDHISVDGKADAVNKRPVRLFLDPQ